MKKNYDYYVNHFTELEVRGRRPSPLKRIGRGEDTRGRDYCQTNNQTNDAWCFPPCLGRRCGIYIFYFKTHTHIHNKTLCPHSSHIQHLTKEIYIYIYIDEYKYITTCFVCFHSLLVISIPPPLPQPMLSSLYTEDEYNEQNNPNHTRWQIYLPWRMDFDSSSSSIIRGNGSGMLTKPTTHDVSPPFWGGGAAYICFILKHIHAYTTKHSAPIHHI